MPHNAIEIQALDLSKVSPAGTMAGSEHPPELLFYQPHWLHLLQQQYGYQFWKTCGPHGEYMLFAQARGLLGPKLVSLPFSDYTIPHVSPDRLPLHIAALQRAFPHFPVLVKCADMYASPGQLRSLGEPVGVACLHRVPVLHHPEEHMTAAFVRGLKKAAKEGLKASISRSEESLQQFYELFYQLRTQKLGLIPQPFSFFKNVYQLFIQQGEGFFYEVKQDEKVLASAIILRAGRALFYKWGCSSLQHLALRPNNLLFGELLKLAYETNCHYLDLGLSDLDETRGLIRFKESMGGQPSYIYTYCICPATYPMALEKQLKGLINQVAGIVVQYQLKPAHTQAFSQVLYPLFV